jgi:hypothetical protein
MYNDLHAPSVPVHPLDGGAATSTTKVSIYWFFYFLLFFSWIRMVLWLMNSVYQNSLHLAWKIN